jgi:SSS family solute:Na+ symporter
MTPLDWIIVLALNGPVILFALLKSGGTRDCKDWFLAGRTLPWWIVGLSLYATLIDSTDLVVDSGATYGGGVKFYLINWVGCIGGWLLLAHRIILPMYRSGMYTNAEYLEFRFGLSARVTSVLVQVLYRTVIIGMISTTNFLTLKIVCGWSDSTAWLVVACIAVLATFYTMAGGLKMVAITDSLQSIVMILATVVLFFIVTDKVGGWNGLQVKLSAESTELEQQMMHTGTDIITRMDVSSLDQEEIEKKLQLGGELDEAKNQIVLRSPAWLSCLSLILAGLAYSIVNHTQSMRLLGARNERHLKQSVAFAGLVLIMATFFAQSLGLFGRALYPEINALEVDESIRSKDAIFPVMVREFTSSGLKGLIVAGVMAAAFSTYDSIGSTLSALITRDVYQRMIASDRDDAHYLAVGRWLTPVIIFGSFLYVPALLSGGLIDFYLKVVGSFVVPLLVVYLLGSLTRVHRSSASVGLVTGVGFGIYAFAANSFAETTALLPSSLMDRNATGPVTFLVTALAMVITTLVRGLEASPLFWQSPDALDQAEKTGSLPLTLGLTVLALGIFLGFVIFI